MICLIIRQDIDSVNHSETKICVGILIPHPGMSWFLVCTECKSITMRSNY